MIRKKLNETIKCQEFYPGVLAIFTNPFYFARLGILQNIRGLSEHLKGDLLDVGCGQKPYRRLFSVKSYTGLEFDISGNRKQKSGEEVFFYKGGQFPFPDQKFDSVLSTEVLEHVFEPDGWLSEINRVMKTGGSFLLSVPFVWDEHEQPRDFARYSSFGLKHLLEKHGFEIIEARKSMNDIRTLCQLINGYLYKTFICDIRSYRLRLIVTVILVTPLNLLGAGVYGLFPKNNDLYLDNIILARKK